MELMDTFIGAADRALRAVFAPAQASRPTPGRQEPAPPARGRAPRGRRPDAGQPYRGDRRPGAVSRPGPRGPQSGHPRAAAQGRPRRRPITSPGARHDCASCDSRPSLLNPLWYAGSFAIGALAAAFGDRTSLGFVAETERQVEGHLDEHLARLPADDSRSRAIVEAMRDRRDRARRGGRGGRRSAASGARPRRSCGTLRAS